MFARSASIGMRADDAIEVYDFTMRCDNDSVSDQRLPRRQHEVHKTKKRRTAQNDTPKHRTCGDDQV